jgi:hypothetical protein
MPVVGKATVRVAGHRQVVKGGKVYADDDPIVQDRPDLFESPEDYQRRKARPQSTAEMADRSMSGRGVNASVETARSAPGEEQPVRFPCPKRDDADCVETFDTVRGAKAHARQAHQ